MQSISLSFSSTPSSTVRLAYFNQDCYHHSTFLSVLLQCDADLSRRANEARLLLQTARSQRAELRSSPLF